MKILADSSLPGLEAAFPYPFVLSTYDCSKELPQLLSNQEVLLCRSTLKVNSDLLAASSVKYIATASSGVDHIDQSYLIQQKISLIDARGANANSVADYIMASLTWLEKHAFLKGKKAGIIGVGKVGSEVSARLQTLGYQVYCYDPPRQVLDLSFQSCPIEALYQCDILCIHAALHHQAPYPTYHLLDADFLKNLKPHCVLLNAARGGIVQEEALLDRPESLIYCTDVFTGEPNVNKDIITRSTLCTPHIAGHSKEAKYAAVAMVSTKLHDILGLALPIFAKPDSSSSVEGNPELPWQDKLLSLYDPSIETYKFKQALDKKSAFLSLREQHSRHLLKMDVPC